MDARNHGDSPHTPEFNYPCLVEDIHCLMNDLNIPKINAIGHSLGGRAMMYFALKYVRRIYSNYKKQFNSFSYHWNVLLQPHLINSLIVVDISPIRTSPAILEMTQLFHAMLSVKLNDNIPLSQARKTVDAQLAEVIPVWSIIFCMNSDLQSWFGVVT